MPHLFQNLKLNWSPNFAVRMFHPLLQLPIYDHKQLQSHSFPWTEVPFAWPAITTDVNDKGCQNLTSSAEFSCMEDDHDLKIYCY